MDKSDLIRSWFEDAVDGAVVFDVRDINAEANRNLRYFDVPPGMAAPPDVTDVEAFVANVVEARRHHLQSLESSSVAMYWWHDELAGQLRYSLVSASHRRLPFAARVKQVESVGSIAAEWLSSPWLHGIPFEHLSCETELKPPRRERRYTVRVWSVLLP